jgi:hypothetical protein
MSRCTIWSAPSAEGVTSTSWTKTANGPRHNGTARHPEGGSAGYATQSGLTIFPSTDNTHAAIEISKTGTPSGDRQGGIHSVISRNGGTYGAAAHWMEYHSTGGLTGGFDIDLTTLARADTINGGVLGSQWWVAATPNSNTGPWQVYGGEINPFNAYADNGYQENPRTNTHSTHGLFMVAESELNVGRGLEQGYNASSGITFLRSIGSADSGSGRIYPSAKWWIPLDIDTDATAPGGTSILLRGGSSAGTAPGKGIKFLDNHADGIDMSGATLSGSAIKLGPTQTITDGTNTKTLSQLLPNAANFTGTLTPAHGGIGTTSAPSDGCASWASGVLGSTGSACGTGSGSGSGTVSSGTAGQFAYYSTTGTSVTGRTIQASDIPILNQNTTGTAGGLSANISESQVTNLPTDLAAKAPLDSAPLTGTVTLLPDITSTNLVSNGAFTSDLTGWTVTSGQWIWSSGTALHVSGTSALASQFTATSGTTYLVTYDVVGRTAGYVIPAIASASCSTVATNATGITCYVTAAANAVFGFNPSSDFNGAVDNVSIQVVTGGGMGIGTNTPTAALHIAQPSNNTPLLIDTLNTNVSPNIIFRKNMGTPSVQIPSGTPLGGFGVRPWLYDTSSWSTSGSGSITIYSAEPVTSTTRGSYISFNNTSIGGSTSSERVRIYSDGGIQIGGTFGTSPGPGNLSVAGNITAANIGTMASGVYTPTLTNVLGVTSSVAYTNGVHYQRFGNEIKVNGRINATTSANGANEVDLSLPVSSNVSGAYDCSGTVIGGSGNSNLQILGSVACDSTNHRVKLLFYNIIGIGGSDINFEFMYTVD